MAANVTVTVTGTLVDGAGSPVTSSVVKAQRIDPQTLQAATLNVSDTASATSDSSTGIFSLSLVGYDIMPVTHKITFPDGQYLYLKLPANAKSTGFGFIQVGKSPAKSVRDITPQFNHVKFIGQDLASATALPQPTCDIHVVTGTTAITSITSTNVPAGRQLTLNFAGILTFTDGNNLKLAGNMTTSADDTISLYFDGTNWFEKGRSAN